MRLLIAALLAAAATPAPAMPSSAQLDRHITQAMTQTHAQGLAIALIDHGQVRLIRTYGHRNAAGAPLTPDTVMYGASLTKAVFATLVMQLVDEHRLDLDRPIADLLPRPLPEYGDVPGFADYAPLAADPRWRAITPRMLLTHSAGFANFGFLEPDGKLRIHFTPGSRYAYSGDGIILLQFVLERGLGIDVGAEIQRRLFDRLGMTRTGLRWREEFAFNLADGWTAERKVEPHHQRSRVRAAGSMDTTITDFARFAAAFVRGDLTSAAARSAMVAPQLPITTRSQFPTLQPELPAAARHPGLAAGLGVIHFTGPQGPGFYKGGHNDSTGNTWVCLERRQRCVVILSNDVRAEAAFPALVRAALGEIGLPWSWEYAP